MMVLVIEKEKMLEDIYKEYFIEKNIPFIFSDNLFEGKSQFKIYEADIRIVVVGAFHLYGNVSSATLGFIAYVRKFYPQKIVIGMSSMSDYREDLKRVGCTHICSDKLKLPQEVFSILGI